MDEGRRVGGVIRNGLCANVVEGLREYVAAGIRIHDAGGSAGAPVTTDQRDGVGLGNVLRGHVARADRPDIAQRYGNGLGARGNREATVDGREAELEGQCFFAAAVVVDEDLVQRIRIHRVIVRTTLGILERLVVRYQRDVAGAPGLVTVEHVKVGAIDLRPGRDERRFAMAGSEARQWKDRCAHHGGDPRVSSVHSAEISCRT